MKLVSVIIPTYKGSQYIRKAVDSIINQSYRQIEVIVVDDNGVGEIEQQNTWSALRDLIESNQIKYVPHEHIFSSEIEPTWNSRQYRDALSDKNWLYIYSIGRGGKNS